MEIGQKSFFFSITFMMSLIKLEKDKMLVCFCVVHTGFHFGLLLINTRDPYL